MKITATFRDTEHLGFGDSKRIMSLEKFRDFPETGSCSVLDLFSRALYTSRPDRLHKGFHRCWRGSRDSNNFFFSEKENKSIY